MTALQMALTRVTPSDTRLVDVLLLPLENVTAPDMRLLSAAGNSALTYGA